MHKTASAKASLLDLICKLAYRSGNFVLSSGQPSSYYINGKQVTLHPYGALWTGQIFLEMLPDGVKAVAGLTLGADPIVTAVSVVSALNKVPVSALIVRKQAKGHGTQDWIEGLILPPDSEIVVVEDVVTTGNSAMFAVERLREAGYTVKLVLTLVDRLQGGAECFAQAGLEFKSVFTIAEIQSYASQMIG